MSVSIAETDAATTRGLRRAVLRPTWSPDAPMHGDENADALHFAAYDGPDLVAACLILPRRYRRQPDEPGAWQLRGMATAPGHRGLGIGARLLDAAIGAAAGRGGTLMWCEARTSAVGFYAQHGFSVDGPEYLHAETAIPHHLMSRPVPHPPGGART